MSTFIFLISGQKALVKSERKTDKFGEFAMVAKQLHNSTLVG